MPDIELAPGCYFDSHRGHYIVPDIIAFARNAGRPTDPFVGYALDQYEHVYYTEGYPSEALIEESDRAIEWLNEHHPWDAHTWMWNDGDFGLYPLDDDDA
jgi:aminoglycoside phosphotransferase (APT) family kinase protein